jgi:LPXTG-motif cell wall-anchored protein
MRTRIPVAAAALAAALALPAAAAAKGPSSATMSGPGIEGAIPITGEGENGPGTPLGDLVSYGGYFPLVFGQVPDPTVRHRPQGPLGPSYTIRFVVPGGYGQRHTIVELLYPFATGGAVGYMRPGQVVWDGQATYGGWYRAPVQLKQSLVRAGLPATPPGSGGGGFWWSTGAVASVAAAALLGLVLLAGAAVALRRRQGPATAH